MLCGREGEKKKKAVNAKLGSQRSRRAHVSIGRVKSKRYRAPG